MQSDRGLRDFFAAGLPHLTDLLQQLQKAGAAKPALWREIGSAKERFQIGSQKNVQRPSAGPGGGLHERHVDLIDIRPLLAIDFDADEMLVQIVRDRFVLE